MLSMEPIRARLRGILSLRVGIKHLTPPKDGWRNTLFAGPGRRSLLAGALSIGNAYDTSIFGGANGDLVFSYGIAGSSKLLTGVVDYISTALNGDYNGNGKVDGGRLRPMGARIRPLFGGNPAGLQHVARELRQPTRRGRHNWRQCPSRVPAYSPCLGHLSSFGFIGVANAERVEAVEISGAITERET